MYNHLFSEWNIFLLMIVLGITILFTIYHLIASSRPSTKQSFSFLTGLVGLYILTGSPLGVLSHLTYSSHMIQMSILYFIIPPFLLMGLPANIVHQGNGQLIRKLSLPALVLFSLFFLLYHFPTVLTFLVQYSALQKTYQFIMFCLALGMWWPLLSKKVTEKQRHQFSQLSILFLTPACLLLIISGFMSGSAHPFLSELAIHLCLPPTMDTSVLLPFPINTRVDQIMSGLFMLSIHKIALLLTTQVWKKTNFTVLSES